MLRDFYVIALLALMSTGRAVLALKSLANVSTDEPVDNVSENIPHATINLEEAATMPTNIAHVMAEFSTAAELTQKRARHGVIPQDELEEHYKKMAQLLDDLFDYVSTGNNAYSFLQAKGLDDIIAPNMHITFPRVRTQLLQILKILFEVAQTTTLSDIPDSILDSVLDIYEQDGDLDIKTHAIELLSTWLPGNPQAQTRVMKVKGLVPFYKQLEKLDPLLTRLTLDLFIKILNEHLVVRNKKLQKNKADYATFQLYQQMGLIERLSTPMLCNGLLKIFEALFSTAAPNKEALPPVLELLDIIKPHCARVYNGRSKVAVLIDQILEKLKDPNNLSELEGRKVNVSAAIISLTEFAELVKVKEHTDL